MKIIREVIGLVEAQEVTTGADDTLSEVDAGAGEKVLGVLTEELQRFFLVLGSEHQKIDAVISAARQPGAHGRYPCSAIDGTLAMIRRLESIRSMFWIAVRHEIPGALVVGDLRIRKGFTVVAVPSAYADASGEVIFMTLASRTR